MVPQVVASATWSTLAAIPVFPKLRAHVFQKNLTELGEKVKIHVGKVAVVSCVQAMAVQRRNTDSFDDAAARTFRVGFHALATHANGIDAVTLTDSSGSQRSYPAKRRMAVCPARLTLEILPDCLRGSMAVQ